MRINEIFYSLQGEGRHAGVPAVFIRFAGCNLACSFCDTNHQAATERTVDQIIEAISQFPARRVILTGGEPTLQLTAGFINRLHAEGYVVHVESNGTMPLPTRVDWLTVSPKKGTEIKATDIDELKVVFDATETEQELERYHEIPAGEYRLQPCDVKQPEHNARITAAAVKYVKTHPHWSLSLQTHKLIDIP